MRDIRDESERRDSLLKLRESADKMAWIVLFFAAALLPSVGPGGRVVISFMLFAVVLRLVAPRFGKKQLAFEAYSSSAICLLGLLSPWLAAVLS